jgi:hypothetical protein
MPDLAPDSSPSSVPDAAVRAAQDLARVGYGAVLAQAARVGAFIRWLLAGTAVLAALVVVNIEPVSAALGGDGVAWLLELLVGSIAFGLLAMFLPVVLPVDPERLEATRVRAQAALRMQGAAVDDVAREVESLARALPWSARPAFRRTVRAALGTSHGDVLAALRASRWMLRLAVLQVVLALAALVSVGWFVLDVAVEEQPPAADSARTA